jgi:AraC-like DNA-binding protein
MDNAPFPRESRELLIEGKIYELLGFVARDLMCTEENDFFPPALKLEDRLIIARDILLERMKNPPGIPELADMVGTNECTLKSSFKRMYGTTVYGFIRSERLARARRLLEAGSCTVTEASQAVGHENLSHFSRNFQERYGIKPKAYAMASVS